ncbi:hypothetical protein D3C87_1784210 [compost metagenome]
MLVDVGVPEKVRVCESNDNQDGNGSPLLILAVYVTESQTSGSVMVFNGTT